MYRLALKSELPDDAWKTRLQWVTAYVGIAGLDDRFIRTSTKEQLAQAALANFAGKDDVMLLQFSTSSMREEADLQVKFESAESESGGSGPFAHVYGGAIPYACMHAAHPITNEGVETALPPPSPRRAVPTVAKTISFFG